MTRGTRNDREGVEMTGALWVSSSVLEMTIHVFTVADSNNADDQNTLLRGVDNTILTDPNPIVVLLSSDFLISQDFRERIN
jgi:hypothetical protein